MFNRYVVSVYVTYVLSQMLKKEVNLTLDSLDINTSRAIYKGFRWKNYNFSRIEFKYKYIIDKKNMSMFTKYYYKFLNLFVTNKFL